MGGRLAAAAGGRSSGPREVSVLTTIVSADSVVSPMSGLRAALVDIEILERIRRSPGAARGSIEETDTDTFELLGTFVCGDVLTLRDEDDDEITIVARRARIDPQLSFRKGTPLTRVPPELAPLLSRATGRGVICYRELLLREGDKLRLKAVIEPSQSVVSNGYRSATRSSFVARDDLALVVLEEVSASPSR